MIIQRGFQLIPGRNLVGIGIIAVEIIRNIGRHIIHFDLDLVLLIVILERNLIQILLIIYIVYHADFFCGYLLFILKRLIIISKSLCFDYFAMHLLEHILISRIQ